MPTSLGPAEILVILIVALIVLGPKRLPEAGRQVGKALAEVRRWTSDAKAEIRSVIDEVPTPSTLVEPVVVSGTATSVGTKADPSVTDIVEPVTIAVDEPAISVPHEPSDAAEHQPAVVSAADPGPAAPPPVAIEAAVADDRDERDGSTGPSTSELPESQSGDPSRPEG
ncbi:MAG TPA: twin-arginine translocase TatA/TatE family subunit [Acidimicrobiales bacterium]|nr:twin-arginine translocase TatA/TatE family subunit [Acidimicrobiales bacterium]